MCLPSFFYQRTSMKNIFYSFTILLSATYALAQEEAYEKPRINFVNQLREQNVDYVTIYYQVPEDTIFTLHSLNISTQEFESACAFGITLDTAFFESYSAQANEEHRLIIDQASCKITKTTPHYAYGFAHIQNDNENYEIIDARWTLMQTQEQLFESYQTFLLCGITFSFFVENTNVTPHELCTQMHQFLLNYKIPVEQSYHQPHTNQYVFSLKFAPALRMADAYLMTLKLLTEFAQKENLTLYLQAPDETYAPTYLHLHLNSLTLPLKENLFFDEEDDFLLSPKAYTLAHAILEQKEQAYAKLHTLAHTNITHALGYHNNNYFITIPTRSYKLPPAIRICLPHAQPTCNPYEVFAWIMQLMLKNW